MSKVPVLEACHPVITKIADITRLLLQLPDGALLLFSSPPELQGLASIFQQLPLAMARIDPVVSLVCSPYNTSDDGNTVDLPARPVTSILYHVPHPKIESFRREILTPKEARPHLILSTLIHVFQPVVPLAIMHAL